MANPFKFKKARLQRIALFLTGIMASFLLAIPLHAAEKLYLSDGPLLLSVRVASLVEFAQTGTIDKDLGFYLNRATPEQQKAFREALDKTVEIEPVLVSRFFNTHIGNDILTRLGYVMTIQGQINGKYALRGALIEAASMPGGLSLINIIQKLPTNMQVRGELLQGLAAEIEELVDATQFLVTELRSLTTQEASTTPAIDYQQLADLRRPGSYGVKKVVWNLVDASRDRSFYVDVYVPQAEQPAKIPVIVFSHGLSSRPEEYAEGLEHLASYGYLVAAPQHPGSDGLYLKETLEGYHRDIFDVQEFINRPKDISFVIDELERRNTSEFGNRLELDNIGVSGHSFGGYTALAIAGAEINFPNLQRDCDKPYGGLDISLLLECRALELPRQTYTFRDERVKAVLAANPVNRSIYGKKGLGKIQIPLMLASGSYDPATPPALEQTASFTWLTMPDKYWMLIEGQAHVNFTKLDAGMQKAVETTIHFALPSQNLISEYADAASVAFFEVYIRSDGDSDRYRPYLHSAYAEYLNQNEPFKLSWISNTSSPQVTQTFERFRDKHSRLFAD